MFKWMKREFFGWWKGFSYWINEKDSCEICGNEQSDYICVGCDRRICGMCESGYYEDANLCTDCRKDITPEELAEDRKDSANSLAEECTCPKDPIWNGIDPINASRELSPEEHEYISKYASTRKP